MKIQLAKKFRIFTLAVAITLSLVTITVPRGIRVIEAKCPNCACLNAPECLDLVYRSKGFPFTTYIDAMGDGLVQGSYRDSWRTSGLLLNSFMSFVATFVIALGAKKIYENTRD